MEVLKFGGASIVNAAAIRNVVAITSKYQNDILLVVSAMGKMTNAFEGLVEQYFYDKNYKEILQEIIDYHINVCDDLSIQNKELVLNLFSDLKRELQKTCTDNYHYEYDRIVSFGELLSSTILHLYMQEQSIQNICLDVRKLIKTDKTYRFANVLWEETLDNISEYFNNSNNSVFITQGFIAGAGETTTSLGREGSDYSAAIFAYALNAEKITIWKDVPGVLTSDPRLSSEASLLDELSYYDAIELAFFGAQVIHPKTIQPLKDKNIPLLVRSFKNLEQEGTKITNKQVDITKPIVIVKEEQVLLSIRTKDFSFVEEENMSMIFSILSRYNVKVNMMQNGAVSFSLVVDFRKHLFDDMITEETNDSES
jgi:aspartate kinase